MKSLLAFLVAVTSLVMSPVLAQSPEQLVELLKRFPEADANKDGTLSLEEAREYRAKMQRERPQQPARSPAPTPTAVDVSYGPHARNVLDFWRADSATPTPLLVFIHGGGFVAGSKEGVSPAAIAACKAAG